MTQYIIVRSLLLGLGIFYIASIPYYVGKGTVNNLEAIIICVISIGQMYAAYILKGIDR